MQNAELYDFSVDTGKAGALVHMTLVNSCSCQMHYSQTILVYGRAFKCAFTILIILSNNRLFVQCEIFYKILNKTIITENIFKITIKDIKIYFSDLINRKFNSNMILFLKF